MNNNYCNAVIAYFDSKGVNYTNPKDNHIRIQCDTCVNDFLNLTGTDVKSLMRGR